MPKMVNYVCRTCLYVCDNEFSFRRLEKVRQTLELFVPEIKTFAGKYSLICEQCYYFLKNVEKFKTKCIETHRKLYSMNIETIRDSHNALLQSVANESPLKEQHYTLAQSHISPETIYQPKLKRSIENSIKKPSKRSKPDFSFPVSSTITSENEIITLKSLLDTSAKPVISIVTSKVFPAPEPGISVQAAQPVPTQSPKQVIHVQSVQTVPMQSATPSDQIHPQSAQLVLVQSPEPVIPVQSAKSPLVNQQDKQTLLNSAADDLLQLFDSDTIDLQSFREFAVKGANSNKESDKLNNSGVSKANNDDIFINDDEDNDEYMTKSDLVSAGILSDDSNNSPIIEHETESDSEDDTEIIEIDLVDDDDNAGVVEFKISEKNKVINTNKEIPKTIERSIINNEPKTVSIPATAIIKQELPDDENPGFFNKQSADGYYKCRLCQKQYKTSKGLYHHTKKIHDEVKLHHCYYCSFFTLWKSALVRHYSIFHTDIFEKNNPILAKCYHCSFQTRSKEQLSRHIADTHVYEKFIACNLCRARFADNIAFAKHVEKEHFIPAQKSEFCVPCNKLFLLKEDYVGHLKKNHCTTLDCEQTSLVIKEFCASCSRVFNSKSEYKDHQINMHGALK